MATKHFRVLLKFTTTAYQIEVGFPLTSVTVPVVRRDRIHRYLLATISSQ